MMNMYFMACSLVAVGDTLGEALCVFHYVVVRGSGISTAAKNCLAFTGPRAAAASVLLTRLGYGRDCSWLHLAVDRRSGDGKQFSQSGLGVHTFVVQ
ncbi:hypothetical protein QNO00_00800 [Arthrobacter sp. zg-Y1219]|uniref:hypothetical protein n=1 Tax=Arthrobacter sp. zg-Y1219 TaxID=3049067 RepID=UPI0024C43E6B|nr:hypothetical protein [Arthrobacter sp. zg-Y1219]MDK1358806.1 hypothetical protein [Arthrobacter sp. zg-Y1219]